MKLKRIVGLAAAVSLAVLSGTARAQSQKIDLATAEGVKAVQGQWRWHDVRIVEVEAKGVPGTTYNYEPKAQNPDFDDSGWEVIDPTTLKQPRSGGQICFCWYRIKVTLPKEAEGKIVHFVTTVDDYGEVWVDGKLPYKVGQTGGAIAAGFNAPNRVELPDAKAGKTYQIAIFGINGPISVAPGNRIFLRNAYLEMSDK